MHQSAHMQAPKSPTENWTGLVLNWNYIFGHQHANLRMLLKDVHVAITLANVLVGAGTLVFFKCNELYTFNAVVLVACSNEGR